MDQTKELISLLKSYLIYIGILFWLAGSAGYVMLSELNSFLRISMLIPGIQLMGIFQVHSKALLNKFKINEVYKMLFCLLLTIILISIDIISLRYGYFRIPILTIIVYEIFMISLIIYYGDLMSEKIFSIIVIQTVILAPFIVCIIGFDKVRRNKIEQQRGFK